MERKLKTERFVYALSGVRQSSRFFRKVNTLIYAYKGTGMITVSLGLLLVFVALLFQLVFSHFSLRLDEAQSLWQTSRAPQLVLQAVGQDVHPPLYHIILHYWREVFGDGLPVARALSLLFFMLCILLVYRFGRSIYSQAESFFAAALLTFSPFMNWYGSEARMYTLVTLFTIINQIFFIRIFQRKGAGWMNWFFYTLSAIAGLYTHYFFVLILASQIVYYILFRAQFPRGSSKMFITAGSITGLAFLPWAFYVKSLELAKNTTPLFLIPDSVDLFNVLTQLLYGFHSETYQLIVLSFWPIGVILMLLALQKNKEIAPETYFLLISVFFPLFFTFLFSLFVKPVYLSRYLIIVVPSLLLFLSHIVILYSLPVSRLLRVGIAFIFLISLGVEIVDSRVPVKEPYREATTILNNSVKPQDVVLVSVPFTVYPVEYYYKGPTPLETFPNWNRFDIGSIPPFSPELFVQKIESWKTTRGSIWLLVSYDQGYEDEILLYMRNNFELLYQNKLSSTMQILQYKFRYYEPDTREVVEAFEIEKEKLNEIKREESGELEIATQ